VEHRDAKPALLLIHTLGAAWFATSGARPDVRETANHRIATLSCDELPAMVAVRMQLTAALGGEQPFEFGLEALLGGIEGSRWRPSSRR
jgi:hypothetical protein